MEKGKDRGQEKDKSKQMSSSSAPPSPLECGEQLLWDAASEGNVERLREILTTHPNLNLNHQDPELGRTAFFRACGFAGSLPVVEELLRYPQVDVQLPSKEGCTPFYIACQEGNEDIVRLLLRDPRVDPLQRRNGGFTPFYVACSHRHVGVVSMLLGDARIDPNSPNDQGTSPLIFACLKGFGEVVEVLLASSRSIDTERRAHQITAAGWARRWGFGDLADLVEEYQKDPLSVRLQIRRKLGLDGFPSFLPSLSSLSLHLTLYVGFLSAYSLLLFTFIGLFGPYPCSLLSLHPILLFPSF